MVHPLFGGKTTEEEDVSPGAGRGRGILGLVKMGNYVNFGGGDTDLLVFEFLGLT